MDLLSITALLQPGLLPMPVWILVMPLAQKRQSASAVIGSGIGGFH